MFYIKVIEPDENDENDDNYALAEICIEDFKEEFQIDVSCFSIEDYQLDWINELKKLISKKVQTILLLAWRFPGNIDCYRRGWIFYNINDEIFIQDRLFSNEFDDIKFDDYGKPLSLPTREALTDEGEKISEWQTSLNSIKNFVSTLKPL